MVMLDPAHSFPSSLPTPPLFCLEPFLSPSVSSQTHLPTLLLEAPLLSSDQWIQGTKIHWQIQINNGV